MQYTAEQRAGVVESTLGLYTWDGQHWLREATSQVNVGTKTVTAQPSHFSIWAVLGETLAHLAAVGAQSAARLAGEPVASQTTAQAGRVPLPF